MSTLAIVLIALGAIALLMFIGGLVAARRRDAENAQIYAQHLAEADNALEQARAEDRGWDREALEQTAREALQRERADWAYEDLHLVLVDDRPGVEQDRAHFAAVAAGERVTVVLARRDDGGWVAESIR